MWGVGVGWGEACVRMCTPTQKVQFQVFSEKIKLFTCNIFRGDISMHNEESNLILPFQNWYFFHQWQWIPFQLCHHPCPLRATSDRENKMTDQCSGLWQPPVARTSQEMIQSCYATAESWRFCLDYQVNWKNKSMKQLTNSCRHVLQQHVYLIVLALSQHSGVCLCNETTEKKIPP